MSRGLPSMTALLGLLAIAGYQNRDKIAEMLGRFRTAHARSDSPRWRPRWLAGPTKQQSRRYQSRRDP